MMNTDEIIELADNEYYRIFCILSKHEDGKWLASVRAIRKDTEESVKGGFTVFESKKNNAIEGAISKTETKLLPTLEKTGPPLDWKSEARQVLMYCKKLQSDVTQFGDDIAGIITSRDDEDKFWDKYVYFWKSLAKEAIFLSGRIKMLNSQERLELLTSPDSAFVDPSDSGSLEDLDLRIMVFDFFAEPTAQEITAYKKQKDRLAKRFEELGWDEK